MQKVYVSRTVDGRYGLFTNGMLACSLKEHEVSNKEAILSLCKRMDFELVVAP